MKQFKTNFCFTIFSFSILFSAGFLNSCVWNNEPERKPWTTVKTLAGFNREFGEPFGIALKGEEIYVSDGENGKIFRVYKDGRVEVFTDRLDTPSQIAFDKNGDLIVADSGTHTIKKIKSSGEVETVAGVENQSGFADGGGNQALFIAPIGVAVSEDKIYVADTYNDKIRLIENGQVSTVAGSEKGFADGAGNQAKFDTPNGLAVWAGGRIVVADTGNRRLRVIETNGKVWTLAGNGVSNLKDGFLQETEFVHPTAVTIDDLGAIFVTDGNAVRAIGRRIFPMVETVSDERRGYSDGNLLRARFNRPSGLAADSEGNLFVADSENQTVRVFSGEDFGKEITDDELTKLRYSAQEFRGLAEPRWCYNPPENAREIAGTLGEIRGEIKTGGETARFHNGLDIVGGYGETARFIRDEKNLNPFAAQNFETLRELLRLPTLGYIHIRLGRDKDNNVFDDRRFLFSRDESGKLKGVRVPRGARFKAGEAVGTLNAMNHVHLIAGKSGAEMNALDALILPGASDTRTPTIEKVSIFDENWREIETESGNPRITSSGKTRVTVRAYDQMDGNSDRRRLGVYKIGYQILQSGAPLFEPKWTISFERMPDAEAVGFVYATGSKSGATGETVFHYIATNEVDGDVFKENFLDASKLENGSYVLRVFAADFFGNTASKDLSFEVQK
jgi:sugar lactone lactonase YvrE